MDTYFDETQDRELPSVRLITRADFAGDEYDAAEFLTATHHFQTLEDQRGQLKKWDEVLGQELIDAVNEDYGSFIGLAKSLAGGESAVGDINMEIKKFQGSVKKVKDGLDQSAEEARCLLAEKRKLTALENSARGLLLLSRRLGDLEELVGTEHENVQELESHTKTYLLLGKLMEQYEGHGMLISIRYRWKHVGVKLAKELESAWTTIQQGSDKLQILQLRRRFAA